MQITNINRPFMTGTPSWSPDGKWIAFDSSWEGRFNVYVVSANSGSPRRLTDNSTTASIPSWSRDGNWIYFSSTKTGRPAVWKAPSAGGKAEQVTRNGGMLAFESTDGKYLNYTTRSDQRLYKCALDGSGEIEALNGVRYRSFVLAAGSIYYLRDEPRKEITIRRFQISTREDSRIATVTRPLYQGLSISPDGRYFIYSQVDQQGADLMLVDDFR